MAEASGIAKTVADAMAAARDAVPAADAAAQLGMDLGESEAHLALPDPAEVVAIAIEQGCSTEMAVQRWREAGAKGRKPGARNKRSDDLRSYLLQFGPHPAVTLMRIQGRPVHLLAAELGCSKAEAMAIQVRCASEVLPFIESRMPVKLDAPPGVAMAFMLGLPGLDGVMPAIPGLASQPGAGAVEGESAPIVPMPIDPAEMAEISHFQDDAGGVSE